MADKESIRADYVVVDEDEDKIIVWCSSNMDEDDMRQFIFPDILEEYKEKELTFYKRIYV